MAAMLLQAGRAPAIRIVQLSAQYRRLRGVSPN